jgi:hypothetical protein
VGSAGQHAPLASAGTLPTAAALRAPGHESLHETLR